MSNDITDLKEGIRRQALIIEDIADLQKDVFVLKNTIRIMRQTAAGGPPDPSRFSGSGGPPPPSGFSGSGGPPAPSEFSSPPVSRSKISTFEWINTDRIKNMLRQNGTVDSILDNITEININLSGMHDSIEKLKKMKRGLMASYTTGAQPYNPHSNVRFQDER